MGPHYASSALLLLLLIVVSSADPTAPPEVGRLVPTGTELRRDERTVESASKEDLFDDVDPKTLAALLLGSLNRTRPETRREEDEREERDRDGRLKLELLMAAQGKEERKKAEEEEEKMTERVSSRTTSQTLQVQREPTPEQSVEEEQLNPEELKNLETVMKEFPRLDTAVKRAEVSEPDQRTSRGYSSFNDIIPLNKGNNVAMSKKKLKWQEETQKAMNVPSFRGKFDDWKDGGDIDDQEEEEEPLSPEEEEARAKAEQEEMRRQAAEVQQAKLEEEKLADIASDMLLRYMVKQNGGKYAPSSPDAAEDKRSEEEREDDDIDPQTIDKLIEISSKLHLPADDVVDIISDVEKKKKKDASPHASFPEPDDAPLRSPVSKQPSLNLMKNWFQEQTPKELWSNPPPQPYSWLKSPKKPIPWGWSRYPYTQPLFYPVYYPPPRPSFRYYIPKAGVASDAFLPRSRDGAYAAFRPKQRYLNWVQPLLRKPPVPLQRKPYYPRYRLPYPQRLRLPQEQFYKGLLTDNKSHLEKYIEQLLAKRPRA
ncbi:neurosecretory protein VGF [Corythoichthys intestinalis]|uniref:neurosecretory protein VGF n=1 Tax=Corythoichthys intestinalis TaxID=161448 RepID=UPI0025A540FA|nr:neurosecretory protein VGF [Corythoichthys intestinalis]XP_061810943.1 neurosecretory protein VGF-like [Nerophis lumbriciformis]